MPEKIYRGPVGGPLTFDQPPTTQPVSIAEPVFKGKVGGPLTFGEPVFEGEVGGTLQLPPPAPPAPAPAPSNGEGLETRSQDIIGPAAHRAILNTASSLAGTTPRMALKTQDLMNQQLARNNPMLAGGIDFSQASRQERAMGQAEQPPVNTTAPIQDFIKEKIEDPLLRAAEKVRLPSHVENAELFPAAENALGFTLDTELLNPFNKQSRDFLAAGIVEAGVSMAPVLLAGAATRSTLLAASVGGALEASDVAREAEAAGDTNAEIVGKYAAMALWVAGSEKIALDKMLGPLKGTGVWKKLAAIGGAALFEGAQEVSEAIPSQLARDYSAIIEGDVTLKEEVGRIGEALRQEANVLPSAMLVGGGIRATRNVFPGQQAGADVAPITPSLGGGEIVQGEPPTPEPIFEGEIGGPLDLEPAPEGQIPAVEPTPAPQEAITAPETGATAPEGEIVVPEPAEPTTEPVDERLAVVSALADEYNAVSFEPNATDEQKDAAFDRLIEESNQLGLTEAELDQVLVEQGGIEPQESIFEQTAPTAPTAPTSIGEAEAQARGTDLASEVPRADDALGRDPSPEAQVQRRHSQQEGDIGAGDIEMFAQTPSQGFPQPLSPRAPAFGMRPSQRHGRIFAAAIRDAAQNSVEGQSGGPLRSRTLIHRAFLQYQKQYPDDRMSVSDFQDGLSRLAQQGHIKLHRADLVQAFSPQEIKLAKMEDRGFEKHWIEHNGAVDGVDEQSAHMKRVMHYRPLTDDEVSSLNPDGKKAYDEIRTIKGPLPNDLASRRQTSGLNDTVNRMVSNVDEKQNVDPKSLGGLASRPEIKQVYDRNVEESTQPHILSYSQIISIFDTVVNGDKSAEIDAKQVVQVKRLIKNDPKFAGLFRTQSKKGGKSFLSVQKDIFIGPLLNTTSVKGKMSEEEISEVLDEVAVTHNIPREKLQGKTEKLELKKKRKQWVLSVYLKDDQYAARTLAHEVGHWIDIVNPEVSTKTDIAKNTLAARIVSVRGRKGNRLKEIEVAGETVTEEELTRELKDVTYWWSPFDKTADSDYTEYRHQSGELYADAVSAMFNNPDGLRMIAPKFFEAWNQYLDQKPEIKQAYRELQQSISEQRHPGEFLHNSLENMFREQANAELIQAQTEKQASLLEAWSPKRIFKEVQDRFWNDQSFIPKDPEGIYNAAFAQEDLRFLDTKANQYKEEIVDEVIQPLMDLEGFNFEKFDVFLLSRRQGIGDRTNLAGPRGGQDAESRAVLDYAQETYPAGWFDQMEKSAAKFFEIRKRSAIEPSRGKGLATDEFIDYMTSNEYYATVKTADFEDTVYRKYGYNGNPFILPEQKGTHRDSKSMLDSTFRKDIGIMYATALNNARLELAKTYENMGDETPARPAETKQIVDQGTGQVLTVAITPKDKSLGILDYYEGGKQKFMYIPKRPLEQINQPRARLGQDARQIEQWTSGVAKKAWIEYRPDFGFSNIMRDYFGTILRVGRPLQFSRAMLQVMPDVFDSVYKNKDSELIKFARREGMLLPELSFTGSDKGTLERIDDALLEFRRLEAMDGMTDQEKLLGVFHRMTLQRASDFNNALEKWTKIAGIKMLQDEGMFASNPAQARHMVRSLIGTPNSRLGGRYTPMIELVVPFSRIGTQGIRAGLEAARTDTKRFTAYLGALSVFPQLMLVALESGVLTWMAQGFSDDDEDENFLSAFLERRADTLRRLHSSVKDRYLPIPTYTDEAGVGHYLPFPVEHFMQPTGSTIRRLAEMFVYGDKYLDDFGLIVRDAAKIIGAASPIDVGGGANPALQVLRDFAKFYSGVPPKTQYGADALTPDEMNADLLTGTSALLQYEWNKFFQAWYKFGNEPFSGGQSFMRKHVPLTNATLRRFSRAAEKNRGEAEREERALRVVKRGESEELVDVVAATEAYLEPIDPVRTVVPGTDRLLVRHDDEERVTPGAKGALLKFVIDQAKANQDLSIGRISESGAYVVDKLTREKIKSTIESWTKTPKQKVSERFPERTERELARQRKESAQP